MIRSILLTFSPTVSFLLIPHGWYLPTAILELRLPPFPQFHSRDGGFTISFSSPDLSAWYLGCGSGSSSRITYNFFYDFTWRICWLTSPLNVILFRLRIFLNHNWFLSLYLLLELGFRSENLPCVSSSFVTGTCFDHSVSHILTHYLPVSAFFVRRTQAFLYTITSVLYMVSSLSAKRTSWIPPRFVWKQLLISVYFENRYISYQEPLLTVIMQSCPLNSGYGFLFYYPAWSWIILPQNQTFSLPIHKSGLYSYHIVCCFNSNFKFSLTPIPLRCIWYRYVWWTNFVATSRKMLLLFRLVRSVIACGLWRTFLCLMCYVLLVR